MPINKFSDAGPGFFGKKPLTRSQQHTACLHRCNQLVKGAPPYENETESQHFDRQVKCSLMCIRLYGPGAAINAPNQPASTPTTEKQVDNAITNIGKLNAIISQLSKNLRENLDIPQKITITDLLETSKTQLNNLVQNFKL